MSRLNFVAQTSRKRPVRPVSSKYLESRIRPNIEVSDGIRPAFPLVPLRYLDVKFQDLTTEQWVVVPKGRIVSALTTQTPIGLGQLGVGTEIPVAAQLVATVDANDSAETDFPTGDTTITALTTAVNPSSVTITVNTATPTVFTDDGAGALSDGGTGTGTIDYATGAITLSFSAAPGTGKTFTAAYTYDKSVDIYAGTLDQTDLVTPLVIGPDASYYGITRDIAGLLVPCNGGTNRVITFDADDVTAEVPDATGAAATVATSDTYTLPANAPIGVAMYDVFQDIRGAYINYELYKTYGILSEQLIKIPFVDYGMLNSMVTFTNSFVDVTGGSTGYKIGAALADDSSEDAGYIYTESRHSFLYFDSVTDATAGFSGQFLQSDLYGNWVPQGAGATSNDIDLTTTRTIQTMGRLLFTDNRFAKDLTETVDAYLDPVDRRVQSTKTAGIPASLFDFANAVLTGSGYSFGTTDKSVTIRDLVQSGAFGEAYIQLMAR